jgi:hypothetical protein
MEKIAREQATKAKKVALEEATNADKISREQATNTEKISREQATNIDKTPDPIDKKEPQHKARTLITISELPTDT